jgi:hypothetical protein
MSNPRTKALRGLARALMGDLTREVLNFLYDLTYRQRHVCLLVQV